MFTLKTLFKKSVRRLTCPGNYMARLNISLVIFITAMAGVIGAVFGALLAADYGDTAYIIMAGGICAAMGLGCGLFLITAAWLLDITGIGDLMMRGMDALFDGMSGAMDFFDGIVGRVLDWICKRCGGK